MGRDERAGECLASIDSPVLLVLVLLGIKHAGDALDIVQAIDIRWGCWLSAHDEVGQDGVVVCSGG